MPSASIGWFFSLDPGRADLGAAVEAERPDVVWQTTTRTTAQVHPSLPEALAAEPLVFIRSDRGPAIVLITGRLRDDITLEAGSLAYRYEPEDHSPEDVAAFLDLVRIVRRAHQATTAPHVVDGNGRPVRRIRITATAEDWYRTTPGACLRDQSTFATYGVPGVPNRFDPRSTG